MITKSLRVQNVQDQPETAIIQIIILMTKIMIST